MKHTIFILLAFLSLQLFPAPFEGYYLYDIDQKKKLDGENEMTPFLTGSTVKLLTGYFAISVLGDDFRPKTRIGMSGEIKGDRITGDLILEGGGDPLLFSTDLFNFAALLREKGVRKITGKLIIDISAFPEIAKFNELGEEDSADNGCVSPLNIDFNRFTVHAGAGNFTTILPPSSAICLETKDKIESPQVYSYEKSGKEEKWYYSKEQKHGPYEILPSRRCSMFAANYFKWLLELQGILVSEFEYGTWSSKHKELFTHEGTNIMSMVDQLFEYSNNLIAESLLLLAAKKVGMKGESIRDAGKVMALWYQKKFPNLPLLDIENGSGMSFETRITPQEFAQILSEILFTNFNGRLYHTLLPITGVKGWIASRLKNDRGFYRVHAKSGTLDYAQALAGIIYTPKGTRAIFIHMSEDSDKRAYLTKNQTGEKATLYKRDAREWLIKSRNHEDELLTRWLENF